MHERPILFSGPLVRAILEGRKTQTRRVAKIKLDKHGFVEGELDDPADHCPYGAPGDRLWVRETWGVGTRPCPRRGWVDGIEYRADVDYLEDEYDVLPLRVVDPPDGVELDSIRGGWRPSIHMFRWASRIDLEVTGVRIERLQDITEEDAKAEGVTPFPYDPEGDCWTDGKHRTAFNYLWGEINGWTWPKGWDANPWVWVVEFRRVEVPHG